MLDPQCPWTDFVSLPYALQVGRGMSVDAHLTTLANVIEEQVRGGGSVWGWARSKGQQHSGLSGAVKG